MNAIDFGSGRNEVWCPVGIETVMDSHVDHFTSLSRNEVWCPVGIETTVVEQSYCGHEMGRNEVWCPVGIETCAIDCDHSRMCYTVGMKCGAQSGLKHRNIRSLNASIQ